MRARWRPRGVRVSGFWASARREARVASAEATAEGEGDVRRSPRTEAMGQEGRRDLTCREELRE